MVVRPTTRLPFDVIANDEIWQRRVLKACHYDIEHRGPLPITVEDFAQEVWLRIAEYYNHPGTLVVSIPKARKTAEVIARFTSIVPSGKHYLAFKELGKGGHGVRQDKHASCVDAARIAVEICGAGTTVELCSHAFDPEQSRLNTWLINITHGIHREIRRTSYRRKRQGIVLQYDQLIADGPGDQTNSEHARLRRILFEVTSINPEEVEIDPLARLKAQDPKTLRRRMKHALSQLHIKYAVVLRHTFEDDWTPREIAEHYKWMKLPSLEQAITVIERLIDQGMVELRAMLEHEQKLQEAAERYELTDGLDSCISELRLTGATRAALFALGVGTVRHLISRSKSELIQMPGVGVSRLAEITYALKSYGVSW